MSVCLYVCTLLSIFQLPRAAENQRQTFQLFIQLGEEKKKVGSQITKSSKKCHHFQVNEVYLDLH